MEELGPQTLVLAIVVCLIIGLLVGYLIGHFLGGGKGKAVKEAAKAHDDYREEVRDHFEHTSQIMSRMVDDYREMYQHMSDGAGKLANIYPEKVITPPPAPEAITDQGEPDTDAGQTPVQHDAGERDKAVEQKAEEPAGKQDKAAPDATPDAAAGKDTQPRDTADESEKERARRLSGEAPEPRRADKSGGI